MHAPATTDRSLTWVIRLLSVAAFASGFSLRLSDPLLPQIALDFTTTVGAAAIIVPAYGIPYGVTQAFAGVLGDRYGKVQAVVAACLISAALVLLCAFTQSLTQLTLARLICAPTASIIVPLGMAYVGDVVPYERRQTVLARFVAGQMMGMIVGQAAGGIIGDLFGWRSVFYALAIVFALAGLALATQLFNNPWTRPMPAHERSQRGLVADYRLLFSRPWARFIVLAVFLEATIFFGGLPYVAADLHARFGISFSTAGLAVAAYGAGGLLYAWSVRALVGRLGERGLVIGGGIVVALGYLALTVEPVWQAAPLAVGALGLGYYMVHNTLQTNATQMLPESRGTAVAAFSCALFLGQSAGALIAAPIVDRAGTAAVFALAAVAWPVLAVWIWRRLIRHEAH